MRDITVKEFIGKANEALAVLKGRNPSKEYPIGGLAHMVSEVLADFVEDYPEYNLEVQMYRIASYVYDFDKYIEFAEIHNSYKPDKRKRNGVGDIIENVELVLTRELPDDLDLMDLPQIMAYDISKEYFDKLQKEQEKLMKQYKENIERMKQLQHNMQSEAYSNEKKRESDKYWETVHTMEYHQ